MKSDENPQAGGIVMNGWDEELSEDVTYSLYVCTVVVKWHTCTEEPATTYREAEGGQLAGSHHLVITRVNSARCLCKWSTAGPQNRAWGPVPRYIVCRSEEKGRRAVLFWRCFPQSWWIAGIRAVVPHRQISLHVFGHTSIHLLMNRIHARPPSLTKTLLSEGRASLARQAASVRIWYS